MTTPAHTPEKDLPDLSQRMRDALDSYLKDYEFTPDSNAPDSEGTHRPRPERTQGERMSTKTGIELIAEERKRQISKEGWTQEHDDGHDKSDLLAAAFACIHSSLGHFQEAKFLWPFSEPFTPSDHIPKVANGNGGGVRDLVKAGALIAAEIDRLQRATPTKEAR